ncbi:cell division protein ZapA [Hyphomicrobium sp.]|uniref:cell division protein ZapA n=1 Tax=Hyphomicrobium sp. TaxID=82 RepID=UPI002B53A05D|nr:cell division protein ZapA [Hyphomicrobium sp.]HVZ04693.1 cell division protein ZapA [Hyphomicrobium sp.]
MGGRLRRRQQLAHVAINFNGRSFRFSCGENEVQRLEEIGKYLTAKLEELAREHGNVGDERLMLMAALMVTDELFDARADIDDLLEGSAEEAQAVAARRHSA